MKVRILNESMELVVCNCEKEAYEMYCHYAHNVGRKDFVYHFPEYEMEISWFVQSIVRDELFILNDSYSTKLLRISFSRVRNGAFMVRTGHRTR
ncbi:hypothetical protein IEQ34_019297 [Dendrobium chrysotoxum]|uniref:LAGLIDADG homing endonuclease n=1 Tax=Dendrobium chrysotoxum TaxID=161865 RepID=A0AAV7G9K0_DENCH|nr:hypothetical protein IEQ34_019297 [Dendrobium chrysotoxum]